ncbi:MAG: flagellin [Bilifractor sp.]|jgi:flagellin-like hook-associated protein FlgL
MVIRTNTFANYAMMHLGRNDSRIRKDLERLSSGYKINRAADDAAGLAISEKMRSTIAGLNQGHQNELDGIGYIQVGDGALSEVHDMLRRMKTLSTEAANGTIDDTHRAMIDSEVQELKTEISRIGDETTYGGIHVFNNKVPALYIEGEIDDGVTIYNDTNDHYTPDTSDDTQDFGGVRLPCKQPDGADATDPVLYRRLRWDEIDAKRVDGTGQDVGGKMAQRDQKTGEWEFTPGEYDWTDPDTKITYHFKVEPDAKVPEMYRMHEIKADPTNGISIDGNIVSWNNVKDANGNSIATLTTIPKGNYSFQYTTATISVYVPDTITNGLTGLSAVINSTQKFAGVGVEQRAAISSTLMTDYAGTVNEKAADTALDSRRDTTSTLAKMMYKRDLNLYFQADENGLRLYNRTQNDIKSNQQGEWIGTKTWEELKVVKTGTNKDGWDWGKNASAAKSGADVGTDSTKFTFTAEWKPNNYCGFADTTWGISIPISISNVARDQAVYKALDGMQISHFDIRTNYAYKNSGTVTPDGTTPRLRDQKDNVSIKIGFTDEYENSGRYGTIKNAYDYQSIVHVNDQTWDIDFSAYKKGGNGNYSTTDKWYTMTGNAKSTLDAGKNYAASALDYMTGLTRANYVNKYVTPASNATAKITVSGKTISFDQITKLDDLDSKGFQLEKDTGNAYSLDHGWTVRFTSGQADELAYQETSGGLRYKTLSPSTGSLLLIDVDSLKSKGIPINGNNNTTSLASAIAEISGESGFYNGMSEKDGSLVISGDVTVTDAPYATPTDGRYELNFTDKNDPSKKWDMLFAYSYADFSDKINITANETAITSTDFGTEMASNNVIYQKTAIKDKNGAPVTDNNGNVEYIYKRLNDTEKKNIISGIQQQAEQKYTDYYNALTDDQKAKLTDADIATKMQTLRDDSFTEKNPNLCKVDVEYTEKGTRNTLTTDQAVDLAAETGLKNVIKSAIPTIHSGNGSTTFGYATNENYAGNVAARVQQHSEIVIAEGHSNILIQNSATIGDVSYIPRYPMNAIFLNLGATNTRTIANANRAMTQIDNAINIVSRRRAQFGSAQNALEHALRNNEVTTENVTSAESRIRDTDMANGVVAMTKDKILSQAAQAMLAQANQLMSSTLTLLQ